jgi:hypothetical protein
MGEQSFNPVPADGRPDLSREQIVLHCLAALGEQVADDE